MRSLVVLSGVIVALLLCSTVQAQERKKKSHAGTSCTDIKNKKPQAQSGVYKVQPSKDYPPFKVYCDMSKDGGWTVFQRRTGDHVSFRQEWARYKNGFGKVSGDYWLGLQKVHQLTKGEVNSVLMVDLMDHEGFKAFAKYDNFQVGSEETNFQLQVGQYIGTAGDSIRGVHKDVDQNGLGFSTMNKDNDCCNPCMFGKMPTYQCSKLQGDSGWWFSKCGFANLNGDYHSQGNHMGWMSGLHWGTWRIGIPYSLKETRMMIKIINGRQIFTNFTRALRKLPMGS